MTFEALFEPLETLQTHDLSPLKSHNLKIQAQKNSKVHLFEEITNASVPSEKKPPLVEK